MIRKLFFYGWVCSMFNLFFAQVNGQSISNYAFSASSGTFTAISGGTSVATSTSVADFLGDDKISVAIPIGFTFIYMGNAYTQVYASSNGFLSFNSLATATNSNSLSGSAGSVRPLLAPLWDDLDGASGSGAASYATTGAAGSRVFTLEWLNWQWNWQATGATISFQVKLYEADGKIEFVYQQESGTVNSGSASIGIAASATGSGNYLSLDGTGTSPTASSTTETTSLATKPATGQVYAFTPPAAPTAPTNLTFDNITLTQIRLNWTDAPNETGYLIYNSTDGVNYTYFASAAANATNYTATSLSPSTTYYWKVYSVNEGQISATALSGSQATSSCSLSGTKTIGTSGDDYTTITAAITDIVNNGLAGAVILKLQSDYNPASETFPITIPDIPCASAANTLTIMPDAGVTVNITSNNTTATLYLNGADYVIIDGRQNGTGSTVSLTLDNTATSTASTIKFSNDATNNTIKYCNITGSESSTNAGLVWFSTTTGTTGNDNNTIEYCNIHANATTPNNGIYASGTSGKTNDNIIIQHCNIYDFFSASTDHCGIKVVDHNINWIISGNSFYETATRNITGSSIEWNAIQLNHTTVSGFTISNNYIGGSASNCGGSAMTYTGSGAIRAFKIQNVAAANACNINGNVFKNISFTTSSTSTIHSIICVQTGSANIGTSSGNSIGDATNPISFTYTGISTTPCFTPILLTNTGTPGNINISNNIIKEIGITYSSTGNVNYRGISLFDDPTSLIVSNNAIYNLSNIHSDATITNITGIFSNASTNNAIMERNNIYNLYVNSTSTSSTIYGIQLSNSNTTICKNNMIRLGYDKNGAEITPGYNINGILESTGYNYVVNNSIFLGGTVSGATSNTYAFYANTPVNTRYYQNNILANLRNGGATGVHTAIYLPSTTGLTCDYNIYYASNTGNNYMARLSSTNYTSLQAWRYDLRAINGDLHSTIADPKFIAPTAATPNLHIQAGVATPVEGSGIAISGITDDFDGDERSSNTPTDIGADAGSFTSLDDKFTPNITYTALTNGSGTCSSSRTFEATITDVGTGVPTTGANVPRVWYKKNSGSWYSAAGTLSSGDGNNGVWSFTIDYTTLGGVANSDSIHYYIVAQDQAATPNIWYTAFEAAAPVHSNVNTQTTPPAAPNSYTIVPSLSGTITVGTSGTYPTLTGAGGLFETINNGVVTGNITANIISDITETGTNSLNQWIEDCGSGYTLTIQPDGTTVRTISGATSNSMIKINRADRITINGVNQYLVFANNANGAAIEIGDGSKKIIITHCDIKSNNTASGVVYISPHSVVGDGPEVTITYNYIHNYTTGSANSLIFINSKYAGQTIISNNNLFDYKTTAIYINDHGTRKYTISGNQIYNTVNTSTGNYSGMYLVSGDSIEVTGNYIGGQAVNCGGSAWSNTSNNDFYGIKVMNDEATMKFCEVKNNTIKNITQSNNSNFYGIQIANDYLLSSLVEGNTISDIATTYTSGIKYLRGIHIWKGANVRKNKVYNLNGMPSSSYNWIIGIDFDNTTVDVNNEISNNMICLDGGGRDHYIYGIRSNTRTSSILNTFYNTVYIKGTISASQSNNTAAFNRNIASNENCRNNIFINTRTGTTNNFAIRTNSSSLANHISTYNLLISAASNQVAYDGSAKDFTTWRSGGKDQSTWCALAAGSTDYANLNPADLFVDAANGDLSINTANAAAWYVFGKGVAGELSNNISSDFYGNARTTTSGMATCIGANEFAQPAVAPISANASAAPAAGTTTTYTFGNRTICSIDWAAGSNVPTSVDVKYYSGVNPQNPTPGDAQYHNAFVRATASGGTEPFNYTMNLYYDTAFRGTVTKNTDTRLSKYNTSWTTYNETSATQSAGAVYSISKSGLTNFSDFTCSDMDHILPVELLVFKAYAEDTKVKLYWSTASETNNHYFEIEHSADAQDWQTIAQVAGHGNSNRVLNYVAMDNNPYNGVNYYRLKQVDFDGQYLYSDVVAVNLAASQNSAQEKWDITLFPNPVADVLGVKAEQVEADNLYIRIYTVSGTLVKTETMQTNGNEVLVKEVMLQDLQPGLYFVEFFDGMQSQTLRMVKR